MKFNLTATSPRGATVYFSGVTTIKFDVASMAHEVSGEKNRLIGVVPHTWVIALAEEVEEPAERTLLEKLSASVPAARPFSAEDVTGPSC